MTESQKCLICVSDKVIVTDHLSGAEIRSLWKICGTDLSDAALGRITPDFKVYLYGCTKCGFRFFDPSLAGSGAFYEELMAKREYPKNAPEFNFALSFAKKTGVHKILDVGGGEGAFLDLAREAGMVTLGIELNRDAAAVSSAKGHRIFNQLVEDLEVDQLGGTVDMLTLFQVMEHVPAPVNFLKETAKLVRPGGSIVVSVPSSQRILGFLRYDPADWPPHHVSRWRHSDLSNLANAAGLTVVESDTDPLVGDAIVWGHMIHNQFAAELGRERKLGSAWQVKIAATLYKALQCKRYSGAHGLAISVVLRKN